MYNSEKKINFRTQLGISNYEKAQANNLYNKSRDKTYQDKLLQEEDTQLNFYDPFQSPPNFQKAERHHQATSIGIPIIKNDNVKQISVCPCCENPIEKTLIPLCCNQEELLFLGVGYALYYKLAKYVAWIVLLIFFISGSALYFLVTLNCKEKCLNFLGFKIISFEPQNESAKTVQFMNMVTAIGIFGFAIYIKSLLNNDINTLESKVVCPSQYTIMLQNLPKNFQQFELKKWIKQTFQAQCFQINIGYNVLVLENAYERRNNLTIQLRKLKIKRKSSLTVSNRMTNDNAYTPQRYVAGQEPNFFQKQKQIIQQIEKCDKIIDDYKNNTIQCDKNGTVFVTFQTAQTAENIVQKYERTALGDIFGNAISVMLKNHSLQFKEKIVKVDRAPAPRQVIWQNLSHSYFKSIAFQAFFIASMCLFIYGGFKYQFKFSAYAYKLRTQGKQSGKTLIIFQSIVMSLMVVILNSLLRIIIYIFTKLKRYHSHTVEQSSFCFYYSLMYIFNSCFMIYIVHGQYPQESNELLLYDIHFIMLANAFSEPLFKLFDPVMWHKILWKRYIRSLKPEKNPYTQMYVHKYFQGHEISNGDNYQYLARMLIVTVWFAHAAPLGVVFCLMGMLLDYWIGKIMLLRVYKKPQNISKSIAIFIINSFQLLPLIYICGVLQFTYKSTSSNASIVEFLMNFFQYSITVSVLIISLIGYLILRNNTYVVSVVPYSQIKNFFGFNYETENPVTKYWGEINYLNAIVKGLNYKNWSNVQNKNDLDMIKGIIDLSISSPGDIQRKRSQVGKLKVRMLTKLSSLEQEDSNEIQLLDLSDKDRKDKQSNQKDQIRQSSEISSSSQKERKQDSKRRRFVLRKTSSIFI